MLTQELLIDRLSYSPITGEFLWRKSEMAAGCIAKHGYRVIRIDGVLYYAHRLAWLYMHGEWPTKFIDHINLNKTDNRIINLRDVSPADNSSNQHAPHMKKTASGKRGVQRNHSGWQAVIWRNGERQCLGTFNTIDDAYSSYLRAKASHEAKLKAMKDSGCN